MLIKNGNFCEIGIIIIDEIHMISDESRGYLLESLITKILTLREKKKKLFLKEKVENYETVNEIYSKVIQIIGISATIGSKLNKLGKWIGANTFKYNKRPIKLKEYIKQGVNIFNKNNEIKRILKESTSLILEESSYPILIFCSTRLNCEKYCKKISKLFKEKVLEEKVLEEKVLEEKVKEEKVKNEEKNLEKVKEMIKLLSGGIKSEKKKWKKFLLKGICYHHAGLTILERKIIEEGLKIGLINILVSTSTLAVGVNLPIKRVIITSMKVAKNELKLSRYIQMSGRAGRMGLSKTGESYLIVNSTNERLKALTFLKNKISKRKLPKISSKLKENLSDLIIEGISIELCKTLKEICLLCSKTFLIFKSKQDIFKNLYLNNNLIHSKIQINDYLLISNSINLLIKNKLIKMEILKKKKMEKSRNAVKSKKMEFLIEPLGDTCVRTNIKINNLNNRIRDILNSSENLILKSLLHQLYFTIPLNIQIFPNYNLFFKIFENFNEIDLIVSKKIGINQGILFNLSNRIYSISKLNEIKYKRLYSALILRDYVNEINLNKISKKFFIDKGLIQNLIEKSSIFAFQQYKICLILDKLSEYNFDSLGMILSSLGRRLKYGSHSDIFELVELPYINTSLARSMFQSGVHTIEDVASSSISKISTIYQGIHNVSTQISRKKASSIISKAKIIACEKIY